MAMANFEEEPRSWLHVRSRQLISIFYNFTWAIASRKSHGIRERTCSREKTNSRSIMYMDSRLENSDRTDYTIDRVMIEIHRTSASRIFPPWQKFPLSEKPQTSSSLSPYLFLSVSSMKSHTQLVLYFFRLTQSCVYYTHKRTSFSNLTHVRRLVSFSDPLCADSFSSPRRFFSLHISDVSIARTISFRLHPASIAQLCIRTSNNTKLLSVRPSDSDGWVEPRARSIVGRVTAEQCTAAWVSTAA